MIPQDRMRRLFSSPILLFIYCSLFFGAILQPLAMHIDSFSWIHGFLFGIPLGLVSTLLTLWRRGNVKEFTGTASLQQLKALAQVVKTGIAPNDPQLRKLLPQYLRMRFPASMRPKKTGIVFTGIMAVLVLPISIAQHNPTRPAVWATFFAVALISHYYAKRIWAKVDKLYGQLGIDPEAPASIPIPQHYPYVPSDAPEEHPSKPLYPAGFDKPVSDAERNRSKLTLVIALVIGASLFMFLAKSPTSAPTPAASDTNNQSNEVVGTVEEDTDSSPYQVSIPIDPSGTTGNLQTGDNLQGGATGDTTHQYTVEDEPTQ